MDYQGQDILSRIAREQASNRLQHANIQGSPFYNDREQIDYKRNYYKDLFQLDHRLQQFQRNDREYNKADLFKKERIKELIDKRMDLKQQEDELFSDVKNFKNNIVEQDINNNNLRQSSYFSPQAVANNKSSPYHQQRSIFTSAGRFLSSQHEPQAQNKMFANMDFEQIKRQRYLNDRNSLNEAELKQINNNFDKYSSLVNQQPYTNNIMNLNSNGFINSEKQIIDYLKALQNDFSLQSSSLGQNTQQYQQKQRQIEHINQVLSFIQSKNPFKPQQELNSSSSESMEGFHINWDFVKFVPSSIKRIKINYGIFKRESTFFTYRSTSDYYAHTLNYLDTTPDKQVAVINEQHVIQSMISKANSVLYFDLWAWDQSDEAISKYGWSLLDVFDVRGNFLPGKYKVPFYPKEVKAHTLFQNGLNQQFGFEAEYILPPLHQKPIREEIIYQPDSINIYTSPDDMPQVGIPKKQEISLEPTLTFEMIMKECEDIKLQKLQSQSLSSFSSFSQSKALIPSLDSLEEQQQQIGFEVTITGFSNVYFQTSEFFTIKGAFMKYDKVIVDEDSKRTVTTDYLLITKDPNSTQVKCEFDVYYKVNFDALNINTFQQGVQSAEKENENEYYLFFCFYNHNGKLIGWTDVDLFDIEDQKVILKQGKFSLQLFNPPLLRPPFFAEKTCNIIELNYEVTGNQEIKEKKRKREERKKTILNLKSKRQVKTVQEIEEEDELKSLKDLEENNQKMLLKIEILGLKNYIFTKNTFGCNIKIILGKKVLLDKNEAQIAYFDNLEIMSNEKSNFMFSHERNIFVNLGTFKKQIPESDRSKAVIQIEIVLTNKKNEHLGIIEIPLFIGSSEQMSRKETTILQKKVKEKLTPLKQELEFAIEYVEQEEEKKYDNTKGFMIEIQQITNYRETINTDFKVKIVSGTEIIKSFKNANLEFDSKYPSTVDAKKKISTFEQSVEIPLNVQILKDKRKKEFYKMYALFIFQIEKDGKKEDYGWFAHPLFTNEIFYEGEFDETLYKMPVVDTFPIDPKKMRKLTSKVVFEVKEVKVSA